MTDIDLDAMEAAALAAMPGPFDSENYVQYVTADTAVILELIRRMRAAEKLQAALVPEWDEVGEARTLAAKFSDPESAEKLRGCRKALKRLLPIDENGRPKEQ